MALVYLWHTEKRLASEPLGNVQDFCPICREVRWLTATNWFTQVSTRILLLIKINENREGGLAVAQCPECKSRWELERGLITGGRKSAEETLRRVEARMALEERARARSITPEERSHLLLEPLLRMVSMAHVHEVVGKSDPASTWGCFGTVLMTIGGSVAIALLLADRGTKAMEFWMEILMLFLGLSTVLTLYAWFSRRSRFVRRELQPRVIRSVEPVAPSKDEMIAAVEELKRLYPRIGKQFDGSRIHDGMGSVLH